MSGARYEIQSVDFANGGRSWHVYDTKERYHIHTTTHGFLNEDKTEPICCTKICSALNAMEDVKTNIQQPKTKEPRYPFPDSPRLCGECDAPIGECECN